MMQPRSVGVVVSCKAHATQTKWGCIMTQMPGPWTARALARPLGVHAFLPCCTTQLCSKCTVFVLCVLALLGLAETCLPLKPACLLLQEGLAHLCLVGSSTTLVRAKIEANLPRKRGPAIAGYDKAWDKFMEQVSCKQSCLHGCLPGPVCATVLGVRRSMHGRCSAHAAVHVLSRSPRGHHGGMLATCWHRGRPLHKTAAAWLAHIQTLVHALTWCLLLCPRRCLLLSCVTLTGALSSAW
jgi:hypothetical protein